MTNEKRGRKTKKLFSLDIALNTLSEESTLDLYRTKLALTNFGMMTRYMARLDFYLNIYMLFTSNANPLTFDDTTWIALDGPYTRCNHSPLRKPSLKHAGRRTHSLHPQKCVCTITTSSSSSISSIERNSQ